MSMEQAVLEDCVKRIGKLEDLQDQYNVPPEIASAIRALNLSISAVLDLLIQKNVVTQEEFAATAEKVHKESLAAIRSQVPQDGKVQTDSKTKENSRAVQEGEVELKP